MKVFQKRRVVPAENWKETKVTEAIADGNELRVIVATHSPVTLEKGEAMKLARRTARQNGFLKYAREKRVGDFGSLSLIEYTFSK